MGPHQGKDNIIALHPPRWRKAPRSSTAASPRTAATRLADGGGYKPHHEDITGTSKASKRRRKIDLVHL